MNERGRLEAALSVAVSAVALWFMIPEDHRRLVLMKATRSTERLVDRLWHASAARAMREELRGQRPPYEVPYGLGRVVQALRSAYESLRSTP